jgi:hypothetical protein
MTKTKGYAMSDNKLFELKGRIESQRILNHQIEELDKELDERERDLSLSRKKLDKENLDLEKMEKVSLTSMLNYMQGKYDEILEKERIEAVEAKLQYDAVFHEYHLLSERIELLKLRIEDNEVLHLAYEKLLHEKETELLDTDHQLKGILEALGIVQAEVKEIDEAILAGENLMENLKEIESALKSAKNWGVFDMLGGDFIADVGKHMKINQAQKHMAKAKIALQHFSREMADVGNADQMNIDMSGLMMAADFLFDNIFVDFMVQNKIAVSLDSIQATQRQVHRAMEGLEITKNEEVSTLQKMEKSRKEFLESKL